MCFRGGEGRGTEPSSDFQLLGLGSVCCLRQISFTDSFIQQVLVESLLSVRPSPLLMRLAGSYHAECWYLLLSARWVEAPGFPKTLTVTMPFLSLSPNQLLYEGLASWATPCCFHLALVHIFYMGKGSHAPLGVQLIPFPSHPVSPRGWMRWMTQSSKHPTFHGMCTGARWKCIARPGLCRKQQTTRN